MNGSFGSSSLREQIVTKKLKRPEKRKENNIFWEQNVASDKRDALDRPTANGPIFELAPEHGFDCFDNNLDLILVMI